MKLTIEAKAGIMSEIGTEFRSKQQVMDTVPVRSEPVLDEPLISARDLVKSYSRGSEHVNVLNQYNMEVNKGDFIALMGPSGSGKSTLLNLLGGIDKPDSGEIIVGNRRINEMSEDQLTNWRGTHIGFVFQMYHLIGSLTAERNVELPLLRQNLNRKERYKRVSAALSLVELSDRAKHTPNELSGGQEQRVAIARAIVHNPDVLLCDEPTGDLDRKTGQGILELLTTLNEEFGKTIVMVTHDQHAALKAKRIVHMENGRLEAVQ